MTEQAVSRRYAKSLMSAAIASNKVEEVYRDMNTILQTLRQSPQLKAVLKNPVIRGTKKLNILRGIFKPHVDPLTMSELELLAKKSREELLYNVCENFNALYFEQKNIVFGEVISAIALDRKILETLEAKFSAKLNKKVIFQTKVDSSIIGGLIINIEGKQIDSSIKSQLQKLKLQFIQK
ncbi:MAG: ATP synthase F1 subunit delta [Microscillaceae bacterium]|nr:ATP synthase F1 subunit delta [Microscillaceae bacterium]MDW8460979.1 ATP synthase F1 subunit delta [Cytophagales bacterium]